MEARGSGALEGLEQDDMHWLQRPLGGWVGTDWSSQVRADHGGGRGAATSQEATLVIPAEGPSWPRLKIGAVIRGNLGGT